MIIEFNAAMLKTAQPALVSAPQDSSAETFQQTLAQASSKSDKVVSAAKQFEALIMGQVLKTARESSDGGWLGSDGDRTGELALEMAEQEFARALSANGSWGIAKLVMSSFDRHPAKAASSGLAAPSQPPPASTDSPR